MKSASAKELVLDANGSPMTFEVSPETTVRLDGRQGSAASILQGAQARVSYEASASQPSARSIEVSSTGAPPSSPQTGTGSTGR